MLGTEWPGRIGQELLVLYCEQELGIDSHPLQGS